MIHPSKGLWQESSHLLTTGKEAEKKDEAGPPRPLQRHPPSCLIPSRWMLSPKDSTISQKQNRLGNFNTWTLSPFQNQTVPSATCLHLRFPSTMRLSEAPYLLWQVRLEWIKNCIIQWVRDEFTVGIVYCSRWFVGTFLCILFILWWLTLCFKYKLLSVRDLLKRSIKQKTPLNCKPHFHKDR